MPSGIRKELEFLSNDPYKRALMKLFQKSVYNNKNKCWEWTGKTRSYGGYGYLSYEYKMVRAHRVSFEFFKGKIPDGMFVCHKCDNPLCINPIHLFLGNHLINNKDRCDKGRSRGPAQKTVCKNGHKLTEYNKIFPNRYNGDTRYYKCKLCQYVSFNTHRIKNNLNPIKIPIIDKLNDATKKRWGIK